MSIVQPICRKRPLAYCLSVILALILLGGSGCVTTESGNHSAVATAGTAQLESISAVERQPHDIAGKLDGIVIPELAIEDEYLVDVLQEILPRESQKADPEGIGVNIVPMLNLPGKWNPVNDYLVTLKLTNATPREVLSIIASRLSFRTLIVGHSIVVAHPLIAENSGISRFEENTDNSGCVARKLDGIVIHTLVIDNETLGDVLNEILPRMFIRDDPEGIGIKIVSTIPPTVWNFSVSNPMPKILLSEELVRFNLHDITPRDILDLLALQFSLKIHVTDSEVIVTDLMQSLEF